MTDWPSRNVSTPLGWNNHYSPKYNKCFVSVLFVKSSYPSTSTGGVISTTSLFDAFERSPPLAYSYERTCLAACTEEIENLVKLLPCSIDGKTVDCEKAKDFISERMKN